MCSKSRETLKKKVENGKENRTRGMCTRFQQKSKITIYKDVIKETPKYTKRKIEKKKTDGKKT